MCRWGRSASDGTVWGIRDEVPHRLTNGVWQAMLGRMSWIERGSELEVWALDDSWSTGGRPFRWSGTEWVQRGDVRLLNISAARDPRIVVGTTYDGRVVRWTPGTTGTWTEISSMSFLRVVSVNSTAMYASDLVNIYEWNGHSWAFVAERAQHRGEARQAVLVRRREVGTGEGRSRNRLDFQPTHETAKKLRHAPRARSGTPESHSPGLPRPLAEALNPCQRPRRENRKPIG